MSVLYGSVAEEIAIAVTSAQKGNEDPAESQTVNTYDVRLAVSDMLFDRQKEEQNLLAALIAARLKDSAGNDAGWFRARLSRSQLPYLGSDDQIIEDLSRVLRQLAAGT